MKQAMSREKNLAKNTVIIAMGTLLPRISSFITLPLLTGCLTKSEYGYLDIIGTLTSLLLPVATLRIEAAAFRYLLEARNDGESENKIVSSMLAFVLIASSLALLIFVLIPTSFPKEIKAIVCCYIFLSNLVTVFQQILRGFSKNSIYSGSAILHSLSTVIFLLIFVGKLSLGLKGVMLSYIISLSITIIGIIIAGKIYRRISIKSISIESIKRLLSYSWPMVPNSLSLWVMNLSDRLLISHYLGTEYNGVYAVSNKIPSLYSSLEGTFVLAWQENASLASKDEDSTNYYSEMFQNIFDLLVILIAVIIVFTPVVFALFIKGDYSEAYPQMPILFVAMFFSSLSSFLGGIYVALMKTKNVAVTTFIAAFVNLLVDFCLIRFIGLYAASISTFISYAFLALYRMNDVKKYISIHYNYKRVAIGISGIIVLCIVMHFRTLWGNILNALFATAFCILFDKEIIAKSYIIIRKKLLKK